MRRQTLSLARTGMLCAAAIALSAAESLFPALPFLPPGAKPGFSNLASMLAAGSLGLGAAISVTVCKAVFAGLSRGVSAALLSLCGGLLSTVVTYFLLKGRRFGYVGIGIAGAAAHNLGQLCVAALLLTPAIFGYLPWLLLFAAVTGTLTGLLFGLLEPRLAVILSGHEKQHF